MSDNARFYMVSPESPVVNASINGKPLMTKDWYTLNWQFYNGLTNGIPQIESAITVGASPSTYTASIKGQVVISGGAGVTAAISRNGTTFYNAGTSPCTIPVCKGDRIRITYGGVPTATFFPM